MNLVRYEPWSLIDQLHRDLNRSALRSFADADSSGDAQADWLPPIDIVEQQDRFLVRADVPGVNPADIEISMDKGILTVAGERESEDRSDVAGLQRYERVSGRFRRRLTLPETAAVDGITARTGNGILEISIPKQPEVRARRITVEAA